MDLNRLFKPLMLSLLLLLSASAQTMNFFGIDHHGTAVGNVLNLIDCLIEGDQEKAEEYYALLEEPGSEMAGVLTMKDFKIPCSRCGGKGVLRMTGNPCPVCSEGLAIDANALRFLRYRFSVALDDTPSAKPAWEKAKADFNTQIKRLSDSVMLFGTVISREKAGLVVTRQPGDETVFVTHMDVMFLRKNASISGKVWLDGTHSYTNANGETVEIPQYTATLWTE